jgi:hypothetical protein
MINIQTLKLKPPQSRAWAPIRERYTRKTGPIQRARKTVAFVRKSGQRRDELQTIIAEGNTNSIWREITTGENNTPVESTVNLYI